MNRSPMVAALADNLSHPEAMAVLDALAQFVDNERACIEEHGGPVERGHGFPAIETVRYEPRHARYTTLEGNCLANRTLPSLAFGRKSCSMKFKREPQDKYVARWAPASAAWAAGLKVRKVIGYDAGPKDSRRAWKLTDDSRYGYWYPLRDWGWDRARCAAEIERAGLPVPPKSACFYCPASKPDEIAWLARTHPDLARRIVAMEANAVPNMKRIEGLWRRAVKGTRGIVAMEANAAPNMKRIEGLWRRAVKGTRGATPHPGSMTVYLRTLPDFCEGS